MNSKEILEKRYQEELQMEIIRRFDMYCESINNCEACEYTSGYRYQYEDRHMCLAKFMLDNYNVSRKFFY